LGLELIRLVNKFSAHEMFISHLESRLGQLIQTEITAYASFDSDLQKFEAKKMMQKMAWLFESMIALEWLEKYGGDWSLIAEIYLETALELRQSGGEIKTVKYFDEVMN
jgi:acyl-CoA dehydrogenase